MTDGPHVNMNRMGRRGFTLLESMIASTILAGIVLVITSVISAGQQQALEAQLRITATIAAERLMHGMGTIEYEQLQSWNGYIQDVGQMADQEGALLPPMFSNLGRRVQVSQETESIDQLGLSIMGRNLRVEVFDRDGRVMADLARFIPEPSQAGDMP